MSTSTDLSALSTPRKLLLGSGVLLVIDSFLPWYHASFAGFSSSASGWHQLGTLVWIILLATLIWEGIRLAGLAPVRGAQGELITTAGAGLVVLLGAIYVIVRLSDGGLGIGVWLGIILLAVLGYAAFTLFQTSGGREAVRDVQRQAAERRDRQDPPAQDPPAGA